MQDLALNITDSTSFVVVLAGGQSYHSGADDIINNCFEEYATRHSRPL